MRDSSESPNINAQTKAENWHSLAPSLIGAINRYEPQDSDAADGAINRNAENDALHRCFGGNV